MAETITRLNEEKTAQDAGSEAQALEWDVRTTLGTLHLAPPPTAPVQALECAQPAPPPLPQRPDVPLAPSRPHCDIPARCYDTAFALLILLSAAVALYRLVWMGQP